MRKILRDGPTNVNFPPLEGKTQRHAGCLSFYCRKKLGDEGWRNSGGIGRGWGWIYSLLLLAEFIESCWPMRAIKKRGGEKTNFLLLLFLLTISTIQWQISLRSNIRRCVNFDTIFLFSKINRNYRNSNRSIDIFWPKLCLYVSSDSEFSKIRQLRCQLIFQN